MKYDIEQIRGFCELWLDGSSDEKEERILKEYFNETPADSIPSDMKSIAVMFRGFKALSAEEMPVHSKEHAVLKGMISKRGSTIFLSVLAAAAIAVFAIVSPLSNKVGVRTVYGYDADGKAITDPQKALAQVSCLGDLSALDSSIEIADELLNMLSTDIPDEKAVSDDGQ